MLDINFIKENTQAVRKGILNRGGNRELVDRVLNVDETRRQLIAEIEKWRAEKNKLGKKDIEQGRKIKEMLRRLEPDLKAVEEQQKSLLEDIPNLPADDVPVGKNETENVITKTVGKLPKFKFPPLDHVALGEKLDIIDIRKAGQLCGPRFGYFKNQGAVLEMALMFYAFKKLVNKGFKAMIPPVMIKSQTEWGCGYTSNKNLFNAYYSIPEDDLIFISSSEHAVVPYHTNEVLDAKKLPIRYVNFSPCFRRESGAYGKDTRGLFRVHFFNKVEMNIFSIPDYKVSDKICLEMLKNEEELMQELGLAYQIKNCCTGDLPFPNRRMYDLETWFPGQNAYRETHSCSNCGDYQARRLGIKTKMGNKNELVHILNATAVTDRVVLAILENFQQKDGSILIPKVLQPYTGFARISPQK